MVRTAGNRDIERGSGMTDVLVAAADGGEIGVGADLVPPAAGDGGRFAENPIVPSAGNRCERTADSIEQAATNRAEITEAIDKVWKRRYSTAGNCRAAQTCGD